jgi:hypothetical protein
MIGRVHSGTRALLEIKMWYGLAISLPIPEERRGYFT